MTLQEILQRLADEKKVESRFPVRLIFVDDWSQYKELETALENACDVTLELADFCSAPDVLPNFSKIFKKIEEHREKHILLLSLGEYLRLTIAREVQPQKANIPSLWYSQQAASSRTRVIIPLPCCRDLWDRVIPYDDERQRDCIWELSLPSSRVHSDHSLEPFSLNVYSQEFGEALCGTDIMQGVQTWFYKWSGMINGQRKSCRLVTNLWRNTEQISSSLINIKIISDVFDYITASLDDGGTLRREWGTAEEWTSLSQDLHYGKSLAEIIKKSLNVLVFEPISLLSRWEILSPYKRWLIWLWYRFNPSENYCGYAVKRAKSSEGILDSILYSIFDCIEKSEWIEERAKAVSALKIEEKDEYFFSQLEKVSSLETRLSLLSYKTHAEKTYAIQTINKYLKKGIDFEAVASPLRERYPLFWDYMTASDKCLSSELSTYLHWYRKHKLMNVLPLEASEMVRTIDLECFEKRYSVLKKYEKFDSFFLWIDAMGVEWLSLLLSCLRNKGNDFSVEARPVCARAPTETSYNQQWTEIDAPFKKLDALDKLAHSGVPDDNDYFSCIAHQLNQIEKVADIALTSLREHDYVLISADHGTSRLAALAFHKLPGFTPHAGMVVKGYGRYCEFSEAPLSKEILSEMSHIERDGKNFLVFKNHEHYTQSGNAAGKSDNGHASVGEVHGGATPEEILVPVVVLRRRVPLAPKPTLLTTFVYREKDSVSLRVKFSKKISVLSAFSGEKRADCSPVESGREWQIHFSEMKQGKHLLRFEADGKMLEENCSFEVGTRGIAEDDVLGE
ncbi:MAG: BREX-4 system phosphatase PglZ [Clostridiaceae bacterium]|nr:BREX-4 system phosphatase PglZ [Clostridiaceae bacterium]